MKQFKLFELIDSLNPNQRFNSFLNNRISYWFQNKRLSLPHRNNVVVLIKSEIDFIEVEKNILKNLNELKVQLEQYKNVIEVTIDYKISNFINIENSLLEISCSINIDSNWFVVGYNYVSLNSSYMAFWSNFTSVQDTIDSLRIDKDSF